MIRMKNRNQSPVNGWQFYEAATGWDLVKQVPAGQWDFTLAVKSIQAMRQKNPRFKLTTDWNQIADELDHVNALRMNSITGAESYIQTDEAPPPKPAPQRHQGLQGVAAGIKQVASGVQSLVDWIGSGAEAVPQEQANRRAATCASCKFNDRGDWTRFFTTPVANAIRSELAKKTQWRLTTDHDAALNICTQCNCPIPLMIWVDLAHKLNHMSPETLNSLPSWCWVIQEKNRQERGAERTIDNG